MRRLRADIADAAASGDADTEEIISLSRLYASRLAASPREKVDEVMDFFCDANGGTARVGLIAAPCALFHSIGLPMLTGVAMGALTFAPKQTCEIMKAAKDALSSTKG